MEQYYYPASDFHITVLGILAAKHGYVYTKDLAEGYNWYDSKKTVLAEYLL